MSDTIEIRVPDIGDFHDIPVIEVLVKPGDLVKKNDSLITLESDKASMEIPSEVDGTLQTLAVHVGDKVSKGTVIATVAPAGAQPAVTAGATDIVSLVVPDIGDFKDVPVIEVLVKPGDVVAKEAPLVVLESEKASMEVPASAAGTIAEIKVKPGDKVSQGSVIATMTAQAAQPVAAGGTAKAAPPAAPTAPAVPTTAPAASSDAGASSPHSNGALVHASPAIRRFARELGVDLHRLKGSGPHGRVTRDDVQNFVKSALREGPRAETGLPALPAWPQVDFARYGEIERKPLSRIKRLSGPNLHRNWLHVPHITNYDEADVTDLEAFRNEINAEQSKRGGGKLTMLAFLIAASVAALRKFPEFNASLDGDDLVYKRYYNIGFAADTPNGLVVPVLKNAGAKGLLAIATETAELAGKARDGKLGPGDMQGGTFTISSIGGIGGTAFTQIVNAPEVAILGAVRSSIRPVWNGSEFVPRLILPISVSYDHRVIDGAGAARFLAHLAGLLADFQRVTL